jgi:hypothetical protein
MRRKSRRLHVVEFIRIFLRSALIASGKRFRHAGDATGFHEQQIAQPRSRQRHDLVFVFEDKAKALAFLQPAQLLYRGFERPMRPNIKYVIRHAAIIVASRVFGK